MRLLFDAGGKSFVVRVSDDRKMFFSSDVTNNKEISFEEESLKQGNDPVQTRVAAHIVRDLKSLDDVREYIVSEFSQKGLVFVKAVMD